jgi:RNA recognition motif-containing protein
MDAHPFPGPDSDSVIDHHTSPGAAQVTVFVGGLPYEVDDLELMDVFSRFGDVSSAAVVMQRSQPSKSRGFG